MSVALEPAVEELARLAANDAADDPSAVGEVVSVSQDEDGFTSVNFAAALPGYSGWHWTVVLATFEGQASVCEAYLLPDADALLAPEWVPWAERVRPGDLDMAMVLPFIAEDPRLTPGYTLVDLVVEDEADSDAMEFFEFGLGRERVLAPEGRDAAVDRWTRGAQGSHAPAALAAAAPCSTCAFFIPLTGSMRLAFGACANEWSPADGRVVAIDFGCGAHSQTDAERRLSEWPPADPIVDSGAIAPFDLLEPDPEPEPEPQAVTDNIEVVDDATIEIVVVEDLAEESTTEEPSTPDDPTSPEEPTAG